MTHRILASPIKEQRKSHTNTEVLDFFMKDDREYTSTELQTADMLYEVRHLPGKYIQSREQYTKIKKPNRNFGSENSEHYERVRKYSLTDDGRKTYKPQNQKSA